MLAGVGMVESVHGTYLGARTDDAALTAAHYLCESGGDVTSDDGWTTALAVYNRSVSYANDVADLAGSYAERPQAS